MRVRIRSVAAVALVLALTACSGSGGETEDPKADPSASSSGTETSAEDREITVHWLAFRPNGRGTVGKTVLSRRAPETPGDFRVEFSANEVGGIGSQSQAGAWNAAIVSTLLLGAPLEGEFSFETDGFIDGPSAGALTTVGLIALARGDELREGVTMTGTINATGMVGPVGGIPEKVQGAARRDFKKVLIPLGQRNAPNAKGQSVDVVRLGSRNKVKVVEVGDIYEAYRHLTGVELEAPSVGSDPRLRNRSYNKVKPQVNATLGRYQQARRDFAALPADVQTVFTSTELVSLGQQYADRAKDLQRQGLQAGALAMSQNAAAVAETVTAAGELVTPLYTQGLAGLPTLFDRALDVSPAQAKVTSFLDQISTYRPQNVSDVEGLVNAYAGTFDAYALLIFARNEIRSIRQRYREGSYASVEEMFEHLFYPVIWAELAKAQIENTEASFEIGRDNPGAPIADDVNLRQVGDFFRRGADANFAAFEEAFVGPMADSYGVSRAVFLNHLASRDVAVASSVIQPAIQRTVRQYIGKGRKNAQYATLGYGLNNYVRNMMLVDKYYNNAELDRDYNIVGVTWDAVLSRSIDLGRSHLATEIELLRDNETEPVIGVGSYEAAGLLRDGTLDDKFNAISLYNGGFLTARVMAYLAGVQNVDLGSPTEGAEE